MDIERFSHSPVGRLTPFTGTDGRTGRTFAHMAFVADPLGAAPELDSATWHAVTAARAAIARLDSLAQFIPDARLLRKPTLRREAQSTSALEGTFAPLEDVVSGRSGDTSGRSHELDEVLNYVEAAEAVFESLSNGAPLTLNLIAAAHQILVRGTDADGPDAGRVRHTPVVIGSPTGSVEDARFVPMPPGPGLDAAARDIFDWVSVTGQQRIDPVVASAMTHYQFESVHPFNGGNGRLGRLVIVAQMLANSTLSVPLLTVSPWFETRRAEYQDRLAEVSASGDWNSWIQFFATGLEASAGDTTERITSMLAAHRDYGEQIKLAGLGMVAREIIDVLLEQPIITASELVARTGRSTGAIYGQLKKLTEIDVLRGPFGTYNRLYIAETIWDAIRR